MVGLPRAVRVGVAGAAAAAIVLIVDTPLGAASRTRGEGRIAFAFGESGADRPAQLGVMNADGKHRRALPVSPTIGVSWSRDGRSVVFGSLGPYGLATINVDGRPRYRRIVRGNAEHPDWSANGRSIAFDRCSRRSCTGLRRDIWVVNLNDRRQRKIVRDGESPSWSPDGRKLAFTRGRDLWILDVIGKEERRLVRNGDNADWSPDGKRILFERWRRQEPSIYLIRADGSGQRRLFEGEEPAWSPNGQDVAFIGYDARLGYNDPVMRARLNGSGRRVLFGQRPYCGCSSPRWARAPRK